MPMAAGTMLDAIAEAGWRVDAQSQGQDMQKFERDTSAVVKTMVRTLDHLEQRYGGAKNYLLQSGVDARQLDDDSGASG